MATRKKPAKKAPKKTTRKTPAKKRTTKKRAPKRTVYRAPPLGPSYRIHPMAAVGTSRFVGWQASVMDPMGKVKRAVSDVFTNWKDAVRDLEDKVGIRLQPWTYVDADPERYFVGEDGKPLKANGKRRISGRRRSRGRPSGHGVTEVLRVKLPEGYVEVEVRNGIVKVGGETLGSVYDLGTSFRAVPTGGGHKVYRRIVEAAPVKDFGTLAGAVKHVLRHAA